MSEGPNREGALAAHPAGRLVPRLTGAALAVAVAAIHVKDQGGLTALKDPAYVGYGYWLLEAAALVCAVLLLSPRTRGVAAGWVLAVGVALGPLTGFVVSRSVGLPHYTEDVGNWSEPIGVASLVVEGVLLLVALWASRAVVADLPGPSRRSPAARAELASR